jgi:hypothetical protein
LGIIPVRHASVLDMAAWFAGFVKSKCRRINSRTRETYSEHFRPSVDLRPNKFVWLGSTRPLDAFKYFFKETEHGILLAHTYQYEKGASTWIIETNAYLGHWPFHRLRHNTARGPRGTHGPQGCRQGRRLVAPCGLLSQRARGQPGTGRRLSPCKNYNDSF